ncbi:hypothetical protein E4T39_06601 [Aureobasidium subglaciale]|nr:hypothetical protein E4T39_06601 [Aureobasidium subglaciale]
MYKTLSFSRRDVRITRNPSTFRTCLPPTGRNQQAASADASCSRTSRASMPRVVVSRPHLPGCLECLDELYERSEIR